jgi:hypothetical protein
VQEEVKARAWEEAEKEALKAIAEQEGERLPDVDEDAAQDENGEEGLADNDDGEVPLPIHQRILVACLGPAWLMLLLEC